MYQYQVGHQVEYGSSLLPFRLHLHVHKSSDRRCSHLCSSWTSGSVWLLSAAIQTSFACPRVKQQTMQSLVVKLDTGLSMAPLCCQSDFICMSTSQATDDAVTCTCLRCHTAGLCKAYACLGIVHTCKHFRKHVYKHAAKHFIPPFTS